MAPRPFPDLWIQIPTKRFVFSLACGSDMVTIKMLPIRTTISRLTLLNIDYAKHYILFNAVVLKLLWNMRLESFASFSVGHLK